MVGYVQAGKTFREQTDRISLLGNQHFIVYTDSQTSIRYLFPVSDEHLDRKDALLAVNHPDFELVRDGMDWVVTVADPTRIGLVERFPRSGGWYAADEKYDIPQGSDRGRMDPRQPDTSLRFLLRGFDWVGLAIRAPLSFQTYEVKQRVLLDTMPSAGFGLITETQVKP